MKALVLRVCDKDGKSHGGFQWPLTVGATVTAPDWQAEAECGNGLHGWLYGQGELATDWYKQEGAQWLVVEVNLESVVMLGGKCKFQSCVVRFVGDSKGATDYLWEHEPQSRNVAVIAAHRSDMTPKALVQVGHLGRASAGDSGTASAGYSGTASAGYSGTASAGNYGTASAGNYGTASAGYYGCICILSHDKKTGVYRKRCAEVDGVKIKANTPYRLNEAGEFVEAK